MHGKSKTKPSQPQKPRFSIFAVILIVLAVTILGNQFMRLLLSANEKEVRYDEFLKAVSDNSIKAVEIAEEQVAYTLKDDKKETVYYAVRLPDVELSGVVDRLEANGAEFKGIIYEESNFSFIFSWIIFPILLFFGFSLLLRMISNRQGGGGFGGGRGY